MRMKMEKSAASQSDRFQGSGTIYQDFTWAGPSTSSPGAISGGQMFSPLQMRR